MHYSFWALPVLFMTRSPPSAFAKLSADREIPQAKRSWIRILRHYNPVKTALRSGQRDYHREDGPEQPPARVQCHGAGY